MEIDPKVNAEAMCRVVADLFGYDYDKLPEHRHVWNCWKPTKSEIRKKALALLTEIRKNK